MARGPFKYDAAEIKRAAAGRWREILIQLGGIPDDLLDGKHHPCPKCGDGIDRFRAFNDFDETGGVYCNVCFSKKNGDGLSVLQWITGRDFPSTLEQLANHLSIQPSKNGQSNGKRQTARKVKVDPAADLEFEDWTEQNRMLAALYGSQKLQFLDDATITARAIEELGGRIARHDSHSVFAFPIRKKAGSKICGYVVANVSGGTLPTGKDEYDKAKLTKGTTAGLFGQVDRLNEAAEIWVFEGITDLIAALAWLISKHGKISDQLALVSVSNGAKTKIDALTTLAESKRVLVFFDADATGQQGARKYGGCWNVPPAFPIDGPKDQKDTRDALHRGHDLYEMAEKAPLIIGKPEIKITNEEEKIVDETIPALANRVYQHGGRLVVIVRGVDPPRGIKRPPDAPRMAPIKEPRIREMLSSEITWKKYAGEETGWIDCHPPSWAIKAVAARSEFPGIYPLNAISETPVLRADGSVVQEPGYDVDSGVYYAPREKFRPVPDSPTLEDAKAAAAELLDVVCDSLSKVRSTNPPGWPDC